MSAAACSTPFDRWVASLRHAEAMRWIGSGSRLCDVGCGVDALFLERARGVVATGIGIDYQHVIARPPGCALVRADVTAPLPLRDACVDHVTLLAVIEHLQNPVLVLREAHRILVAGGSLVMTWPSASVDAILHVLRRIGVVSPEMECDQHQPRRPPAEWTRVLEHIGFHHVRHHTFELGLNHLMVAVRRLDRPGTPP